MGTIPQHSGAPHEWLALQSVTQAHFRDLHAAHPTWTMLELFAHLQIAPSPLLCDMAHTIGFTGSPVSPIDSERVLGLWSRGVWSAQIISEETGVGLEQVKATLAASRGGYGLDCYGTTPYGGGRAVSDGTRAVLRRVTEVGQMSYRGHLYSLGISYRGRTASLIEREHSLIASFADRPVLHLAKRRHRRSTNC